MAGKDGDAPNGSDGAGTRLAASSSAPRRKLRRASGHVIRDLQTDPGLIAFAFAGMQGGPGASAAASEVVHRVTSVDDFVRNFYAVLNRNPQKLYLFYHDNAQLVWKGNGLPVHLKTLKEIKDYFSDVNFIIKLSFAVDSFETQSCLLNSVFLMVNGTCQSVDDKISHFVQSFVLLKEHHNFLITNDLLAILENAGSGAESLKKLIDDEEYYCGICKEPWHQSAQESWVGCDGCQTWVHVQCDKTCTDIEDLENKEYFCPDCKSKVKDVLTDQDTCRLNNKNTSKENLPEPIPVSCCEMEGLYLPEKRMISCQCKVCMKIASMMSLNEWEKHAGSKKKNWKMSIKLKGSENLLSKLILSKSYTAKKHKIVPAEFLENKQSGKLRVCILEECDGMMNHKPRSKLEPEKPERIQAIQERLREDGVLDRVHRQPFDRADRKVVLAVHTARYLDYIDRLSMSKSKQKEMFPDFVGENLYSSKGSSAAVYWAAGAVIEGCKVVAKGVFDKAFAIIRPPGHHADRSKAEGFCYLNNMAIGAQHLLDSHNKKKILLVDFDVHHGDGTQRIFYESDQVLFFSTHRGGMDYYPASEKESSFLGEKQGLGYNVNVPLEKGFGDKDLLYVWEELLLPLASKFSPEMVLVSAGYDAVVGDHVGQCNVSPKCFGTLVQKLLSLAEGKMVLGLEGGYEMTQLSDCVSHTLRALLGDNDAFYQEEEILNLPSNDVDPSIMEATIKAVGDLKVNLRAYWDVFKIPGLGTEG